MLEKEAKINELAEQCQEKGHEALKNNNLKEASALLQEAVHLFKKSGNYYKYARCANMLGVTYANIGDEVMSVDWYLEGLECAKDKNLKSVFSLFYNNIGSRYQELEQHKKAIFYFERARESLGFREAQAEEQYMLWNLICALNLCVSHLKSGEMQIACNYLQEAEGFMLQQPQEQFRLSMLTFRCEICWNMGKKEFVYQNLDQLLQLAEKLDILDDYVQNVREVAELFSQMKDYQRWKKMLCLVEQTANQQDSVYYHLTSVEMWMRYYLEINEKVKYNALCVRHASLYQEQKKINYKERILALDIKIALREKEEQWRAAEVKSRIDVVTGLGNRYSLELDSRSLAQEAAAEKRVIVVGLLDIDCFKQVNDTYGHLNGDACLKTVADMLTEILADSGKAYRFGGDEFVLLLPHGDYEIAERIGKRIKEEVYKASIPNEKSEIGTILTVSQGYACFKPKSGDKLADLLEHADMALYKMKDAGRNGFRVILEDL